MKTAVIQLTVLLTALLSLGAHASTVVAEETLGSDSREISIMRATWVKKYPIAYKQTECHFGDASDLLCTEVTARAPRLVVTVAYSEGRFADEWSYMDFALDAQDIPYTKKDLKDLFALNVVKTTTREQVEYPHCIGDGVMDSCETEYRLENVTRIKVQLLRK